MSIVDKKKKVFGKIAATKTLISGLPTLKLTSSLQSINNGGNSITFLSDLIKSLIGYEALVESLVDILTHSIAKIELAVKKNLKTELKTIVSCGVDPHLPNWVKSDGDGVTIEVKKIDFFDILRTNPTSLGGGLLYNDITPTLTDSKDFNTFLFGVIQDDGIEHTWSYGSNNIFNITFNSLGNGVRANNSLTITAHPDYDNKTLTDLNNDFIDSITLFNTENVVNQVMDIIYGAISSKIGKSLKQIESEANINGVIDKMVNSVNTQPLENDAFKFTNAENLTNQAESLKRKAGLSSVKINTTIPSTIPISSLTEFTQNINNVNSTQQKKEVITNSLKSMANFSSSKVTNPTDVVSVKLNFIQIIINNLVKSITNMVLSPKVIFTFIINYRIVYGAGSEFTDPIDFIKKNKKLMNEMMKGISEEIIKILLAIALKEIASLVTKAATKRLKEKSVLKLAQLQSLVGVPISKIKKLIDRI